jgi:hypothetical protein
MPPTSREEEHFSSLLSTFPLLAYHLKTVKELGCHNERAKNWLFDGYLVSIVFLAQPGSLLPSMAFGEQRNRYGKIPISVPLFPDTQSRRRLEPLLLLGPASSSEKRTVMTISLEVAEEFILAARKTPPFRAGM